MARQRAPWCSLQLFDPGRSVYPVRDIDVSELGRRRCKSLSLVDIHNLVPHRTLGFPKLNRWSASYCRDHCVTGCIGRFRDASAANSNSYLESTWRSRPTILRPWRRQRCRRDDVIYFSSEEQEAMRAPCAALSMTSPGRTAGSSMRESHMYRIRIASVLTDLATPSVFAWPCLRIVATTIMMHPPPVVGRTHRSELYPYVHAWGYATRRRYTLSR